MICVASASFGGLQLHTLLACWLMPALVFGVLCGLHACSALRLPSLAASTVIPTLLLLQLRLVLYVSLVWVLAWSSLIPAFFGRFCILILLAGCLLQAMVLAVRFVSVTALISAASL